jgi:hypothetical protein
MSIHGALKHSPSGQESGVSDKLYLRETDFIFGSTAMPGNVRRKRFHARLRASHR